MKTHNLLYVKLCSLDNLRLAYRKARKGKTKEWYVIKFEEKLDDELIRLKHELETQTYKPKSLKRFIIADPKTRVIHASHFRDRIVHHATFNIIEPIFDKTFIYDSYANRKEKGSLAAINRFDYFKRKVSENGRLVKDAKDNNMIIGYVLKADIKHYFHTVDHDVLMSIIKKKISDNKLLRLIRTILDENSDYSGKGMPIGNLTSQLFANVYLNELDYFVKHKLRAKYYLRYVDDFAILDKNRKVLLEYRESINDFLKSELKIELHEEKSQVYPLHGGIGLLGYRMFYYYRLPTKRNIRMLRNRLLDFERQYRNGEISKEKISESIEGWCAYAKWANTYKLRREILKELSLN